MSTPPPPPPPRGDASERQEWRHALLVFGPAIAVAFLLERVLRTATDLAARQALAASVVAGIVIAVVLERVLRKGKASDVGGGTSDGRTKGGTRH